MSLYLEEETVAAAPAPEVNKVEAPMAQPPVGNPAKPAKGKKGLGVVFSIIAFVFGITIFAAAAFGIVMTLLFTLDWCEMLPEKSEMQGLAYTFGGIGIGAGILVVAGGLLFMILAMVFSGIAKKKTDAPKGLVVIGRLFAVLSLIFYILMLVTLIACGVLLVMKLGPEIAAMMGGE